MKHYRNDDKLALKPAMIFTIDPMFVEGQGNADVVERWSDGWTVVTKEGGLAAQFEHTVLILDDGVEVLTTVPKE